MQCTLESHRPQGKHKREQKLLTNSHQTLFLSCSSFSLRALQEVIHVLQLTTICCELLPWSKSLYLKNASSAKKSYHIPRNVSGVDKAAKWFFGACVIEHMGKMHILCVQVCLLDGCLLAQVELLGTAF